MEYTLQMSRNKNDQYPVLPYDYPKHYPSRIERFLHHLYNTTFDRLYPIKPWIFTSISLLSTLYFHLNRSRLPKILSKINTLILGIGVAYLPVLCLRLLARYFLFAYKGHLSENLRKSSLKTQIWRVCFFFWRKLVPKPRLLTCNSLLPRQSVPKLSSTIERYLDSMHPLLSENNFKTLRILAIQFEENEGSHLQHYAWLYSLWARNYITSFVDMMRRPFGCSQASRAGHCAFLIVVSMLKFGNRTQAPLHNGQMYSGHYTRLYANCRIPQKGQDKWASREYSKHLIVIASGCFYRVECFDEKNRLYSLDDFVSIMVDIIKRRDVVGSVEGKVAALTTDNRDQWALNRQRFFVENKENRHFLDQIEKSIAVIVLDNDDYGYVEGNYETLSNLFINMLAGDGSNRWADKPLTYVFGKNGSGGANSEHSVADGAEFVNSLECIFGVDAVCLRYSDSKITMLKQPRPGLKLAERMTFEMVEGMSTEINRCYEKFVEAKADVDAASMVFTDWGKGKIKQAQCSPDAFFQMAVQLAYYRDQGHHTLTYESASSRFYDNTRTETIRSVSEQSCAFVQSMINGHYNQAECARMCREACAQHQIRTREAMTGSGIDRHLFVLHVMSKYLNIQSTFLDQVSQQQQFRLSTSQSPLVTNIMNEDMEPNQPEQCWLGGAFGAVTKDGYGLCYRFIGNHSMVFHISSYYSSENTDSKRFRLLLTEALEEMMDLFEEYVND